MRRCTFYRSFSWYRAGRWPLGCPLVADISEIEFVHNEALVAPQILLNVPRTRA